MRPRVFFLTMITVLIFVVTVILVTAGFILPVPVNQAEPEIETPQNLAKSLISPESRQSGISTPAASEDSQADTQQAGKTILEEHCSQCHPVQSFENATRSRTEWESILKQMEDFGVQLSETEKVDLIIYLAGSEK